MERGLCAFSMFASLGLPTALFYSRSAVPHPCVTIRSFRFRMTWILRMDTRTAAAVLALSLCGCAIFSETHGMQEVDDWVRSYEPLAESGKMKWSDFYAQYLEKVSAAPVISQSPVVERLGIMITAPRFCGRCPIGRGWVDSMQNRVRECQALDDPAANLLARGALVRALGSEPHR